MDSSFCLTNSSQENSSFCSLPPLASIDEMDTDDDLGVSSSRASPSTDLPPGTGYISSSRDRSKIILTNSDTVARPSQIYVSSSSGHRRAHRKSNSISSPYDCFGPATTMGAGSGLFGVINSTGSTQLDYSTDELGDTGFFSSMSCSSKRSSIDESSAHSLQSSSFQQHSSFFDHINQQEEEEEDEEQLLSMDGVHPDATAVAMTPGEEATLLVAGPSPDLSNSLEDLVNCFDEKVTDCLHNLEQSVEQLAPVQIRSPEEVLKGRPAWWTLTGNYGNILPIDWAKLSPESNDKNLDGSTDLLGGNGNLCFSEEADEDEKLRHLIDSCLSFEPPIKSADDVLEEIDAIMSSFVPEPQSSLLIDLGPTSSNMSMMNVPLVKRMTFYRFSLEKLKSLSLDQLQDLNEDLEVKVQKHSETLIGELARRDELEFEKELKNRFISLMLKLQNRRKEHFLQQQQQNVHKKNVKPTTQRQTRRYLTTVIPYNRNEAADNVPVLQVLIKILQAMLEDSPTVPTLLTDYILKHICPPDQIASNGFHPAYHSNQSFFSIRGRTSSSSSTTAASQISQLTSSINSKLKAAARRSFSFNRNTSSTNSSNNNNNNDSNNETDNYLLSENNNNNNNVMATMSTGGHRKSSISSAASFDNAIVV